MKANKIVLFMILLLLAIAVLPARSISVDEAVNLALSSSLQMENAKLELDSLKRQSKDSWGTLLPTMRVSGTLAKAENPATYQEFSNTSANLAFNFSFNFSPAMITSIRATKQSYINGLLTYEQAKAEMKVNVEKLYYAIVLQEEALKIKQDSLQIKKDRMDQALTDFENGYVPELYVLNTQVTYQNAKPEVDEAELSLAANKRNFAFLLGLDISEEITLTDTIDQDMVEINEATLLDNIAMRHDLSSIANSAKLLKLNKRALKESAFLPAVAVTGAYGQALGVIKDDNWLDLDNYIETKSLSVTVAYDLANLFPQSSTRQNLKKIKETENQLSIQYRMAEEGARLEVLSLFDKLQTTKEQIENFDRTVRLAESSYKMTQESYNNGTSDYLDLKDAENSLAQARLGRLSSQYDYLSALIDLEYATNQNIR